MIDGHKKNADGNHGQRHAEIILHKSHSIVEGLAGHGEKGNGTGLRAHNAQQHQVPGHGAVPEEIAIEIAAGFAFVQAETNNQQQSEAQYNPVDLAHEKYWVKK